MGLRLPTSTAQLWPPVPTVHSQMRYTNLNRIPYTRLPYLPFGVAATFCFFLARSLFVSFSTTSLSVSSLVRHVQYTFQLCCAMFTHQKICHAPSGFVLCISSIATTPSYLRAFRVIEEVDAFNICQYLVYRRAQRLTQKLKTGGSLLVAFCM